MNALAEGARPSHAQIDGCKCRNCDYEAWQAAQCYCGSCAIARRHHDDCVCEHCWVSSFCPTRQG